MEKLNKINWELLKKIASTRISTSKLKKQKTGHL